MKDQLKHFFFWHVCACTRNVCKLFPPSPPISALVETESVLEDSLQRQNLLLLCNERSDGHLSGHMNTHNARIWSLENPHDVAQSQRDAPKLNVFLCHISAESVCAFRFRRTNCNWSCLP
ncbi:hypothetical protein TNCV_3003771 [Trichonephila clavipes]|nr:hypothetical protein TNCV_3003771 [Trichonephila clavipes]